MEKEDAFRCKPRKGKNSKPRKKKKKEDYKKMRRKEGSEKRKKEMSEKEEKNTKMSVGRRSRLALFSFKEMSEKISNFRIFIFLFTLENTGGEIRRGEKE